MQTCAIVPLIDPVFPCVKNPHQGLSRAGYPSFTQGPRSFEKEETVRFLPRWLSQSPGQQVMAMSSDPGMLTDHMCVLQEGWKQNGPSDTQDFYDFLCFLHLCTIRDVFNLRWIRIGSYGTYGWNLLVLVSAMAGSWQTRACYRNRPWPQRMSINTCQRRALIDLKAHGYMSWLLSS